MTLIKLVSKMQAENNMVGDSVTVGKLGNLQNEQVSNIVDNNKKILDGEISINYLKQNDFTCNSIWFDIHLFIWKQSETVSKIEIS